MDNCKAIQSEVNDLIISNESFVKGTKEEEKYYSRLVSNMYSACLKQFEKASDVFNIEQNKVSDYLKQSIIRDAEILMNKSLTEKEQENVLENPEIVQDLMKSKLEGQAHSSLTDAVNDLSDRHNAIIKLEKSINDVFQLFVDLQELVRCQGEIIDNIEMNISTAKNSTLNAELDLVDSLDNLKSARKKKCIIIIIVLVIMGILIGTIVPTSLL